MTLKTGVMAAKFSFAITGINKMLKWKRIYILNSNNISQFNFFHINPA